MHIQTRKQQSTCNLRTSWPHGQLVKMCVLTVTAVTSLTVPAPVVDWTDMSTESEDSGNHSLRQATLHFGPSHPCERWTGGCGGWAGGHAGEGGEERNFPVTINESRCCESSGFLELTVELVAIHSLQTAWDSTAGLQLQTCGHQIIIRRWNPECKCTHTHIEKSIANPCRLVWHNSHKWTWSAID